MAPLVWLAGAVVLGGIAYALSGGNDKAKGKTPGGGGGGGGGDYDDGLKSGDDMPGGETETETETETESLLEEFDCSNVMRIPGPTGSGTDFDALPDVPLPELEGASLKDIFWEPMTVTIDQVNSLNQEAGAMIAEELGKKAFCSGYEDVAQQLYDKAAEIRSWDVA
jgi:hypothetical protein